MISPVIVAWCAVLAAGDLPFDPRHHFDSRCPGAIKFDDAGEQRDPDSTSIYLQWELDANASAMVVTTAALLCRSHPEALSQQDTLLDLGAAA